MKFWFLMSALAISVLPLSASDPFATGPLGKPLVERIDPQIHDEVDPTELQWCYSMGQISLTYESGEVGAPKVGLRITDPRGRKIGYDPRTHKGWQELPLAQGFLDCAENEDSGELRRCAGHIEICGPVSGTYKLEVLPAQSGKYSINVSGRSHETWDELGLHSTASQVEVKSEIRKKAPAILLLRYSRETGAQIELNLTDQRAARWETVRRKSLGLGSVTTTKGTVRSSQ